MRIALERALGALVGAAWASGLGVARLRELAISVHRRDIFQVAHADMAFKRMLSPALFRREPLEILIRRVLGDVRFDQLDPPVVVNSVDLNSGMQVFWGMPGLDGIPVRDAVFASCALPGYFPPHEISGRFYVDGAVVANVPFVAARALGPELIVAVDVSASSVLTADAQDEGFAGVFARATEILMQTLLEQRVRTWTTPPVYWIQPRVEHVTMFSFDHLREEVEEGYRATIAALDRPAEWPAAGDVGIFPKRRVMVRVEASKEKPALPTVSHIFPSADWYEREACEMYGIDFKGHPNLSRLILPEFSTNHPLKKGYEYKGDVQKDIAEMVEFMSSLPRKKK